MKEQLVLMKKGERVFIRLGVKGEGGFIAELEGIHEESVRGFRNRVISVKGSIWYRLDAVTEVSWDSVLNQWYIEAYAAM